ncbi:hypothetical protein HYS72_01755 [Candidatus Pacearchaeota archaeon]|nr:hypothetical protein [Candidatus Pacearchaeota archaeon]MBI2056700.1 hypothetical protein [Candidatus Pacearchaeota archaeon]
MEIIEEISEFFENLYSTFISKLIKIIYLSFTIFLTLPIIKWFISAIIYMFKPIVENLDNFTIATFIDNVIP